VSDESNKLVDEEVSSDASVSSTAPEAAADRDAPEAQPPRADAPAPDHATPGEEDLADPSQPADEAAMTSDRAAEADDDARSAEQMGESAPPAEDTSEETSAGEEVTAESEKGAAEDATTPEEEQAPEEEHATEEEAEEEVDDDRVAEEEITAAETAEDEPAKSDEPAKPKEQLAEQAAAEKESEEEITLDWYILKVQSNREKSISEALERRVKIAGLEAYFDQVIVPTEKVTEFKGGRKRVVNRKLYPGYILVRMHINDDTWFLVRETPGIGDFTGSGGKPTPMLPHEVQRIVSTEEEKTDEAPKLKIGFKVGDRVKINEGTFENFEGEVSSVDEASGRITVMINIFGRSTPVELEYWQAEAV